MRQSRGTDVVIPADVLKELAEAIRSMSAAAALEQLNDSARWYPPHSQGARIACDGIRSPTADHGRALCCRSMKRFIHSTTTTMEVAPLGEPVFRIADSKGFID